jgi:hypothetical protein
MLALMRRTVQLFLARAFHWLTPRPDQSQTINVLSKALAEAAARDNDPRAQYMASVAELAEARLMAGGGPWRSDPIALQETDRILTEAVRRFDLKESIALPSGGFGDVELALMNSEWRRDVNLSRMEFSQWGIQQIILIARLHYVKNPIIRRLVDVCAAYVFARGFSVSSGDEDANAVIQDFLERNKRTLGQNALTELEKRKDYDGNIFFVLFPDTQNTGQVNCRTIDAIEIQEVVCDPEDVDTPRYYLRRWTQQIFDENTGQTKGVQGTRWYPALGYNPEVKPATLGDVAVAWDSPVLHRKCGGIAKWSFGCPRVYPAIAWAKESNRYLESCASVAQALSQIALLFTTKGGQQALAGAKDQLGTGVNSGGPSLWDPNPPATAGSTFASGPGTTLQAFKTQGAGMDPEKVRQYKLMCCMVKGVPETFLGDVSTGNLATAQSLDRPTESIFLDSQESWREDLVALCSFAAQASMRAPSGRMREALQTREGKPATVAVREARRVALPNGRMVYEKLVATPKDGAIELRAEFPAIREGDLPALVTAVVEAMTVGGSVGHGIDEKEGVRKLYDLLGIEGGDELLEDQYPDGTYDPEREPQEPTSATGDPTVPPTPKAKPVKPTEAVRIEAAMKRLGKALRVYEASRAVSAS